ncbi:hypothetical protein [uncultured Bacteroides sp.]|uniref:hypothetical protein n=1 Tax=uncultured Bacteroides sp. TaxID=162156 RepID=UPI002AABC26B|nr:hypothetical protein [uncultured Bacteroides sp.]
MKKIIILILIFLPIILKAQTRRTLYRYIDLSGGININLSNPKFDNLIGVLSGTQTISPFIKGRFSYFFNSKWGAFSDSKFYSVTFSERDLSNFLPKPYENLYYKFDEFSINERHAILGDLAIGATYRIENKNWSVRPRIGFGIGEVAGRSTRFSVKGNGTNNIYEINYLSGNKSLDVIDLPIIKTGINLDYKFDKIHLVLDIDYTQFIKKVSYTYQVQDAYTEEFIDNKKIYSKALPSNLDIGLGVGLNF